MRTTLNWIMAGLGLLLTVPALAAGVGVDLLKLPLRFEPNADRPEGPTEFVARGPAYAVLVAPAGVRLQLPAKPVPGDTETTPSSSLCLNLVGANPSARLTGMDELQGKANYFRGNDPAKWRRDVPTFGKVRCEQVYPGIDLIYYGTRQEQLEYDFIVAPGADPGQIALEVEGVDRVEVDSHGDLVIESGGGQVRLHRPLIYQIVGGSRQEIAGGYRLRPQNLAAGDRQPTAGHGTFQVAFELASFDPALPLVIDPVLVYSTYLGGTGLDSAWAMAVDAAGNVYVTGYTESADFPTADPLDGSLNDSDAFVVKLNADGSGFDYATYIGGRWGDQGSGIAVATDGSVCVTGKASGAPDFPLVSALQSVPGGGWDAFLLKLNPEGNGIVYSTFLGGSNKDEGSGVAVDATGQACVTGFTSSPDFLVSANAIQSALSGSSDVFVTKLSADGTSLVYSTYLGGSGEESAPNVALDPSGHAYVAGLTGSTNFPTTSGALQAEYGGGVNDVFVAKIQPDGSALAYATYLGGSEWDAGWTPTPLAMDLEGCAYVAGASASADFPLIPSPLSHPPHYPELLTRHGLLYLSKLAPDGASLRYSVRLPGSHCYGMTVDQAGHAWVVGANDPYSRFPLIEAIQPTHGGVAYYDGFVLKLAPDADHLLFASYFGGTGDDNVFGVCSDNHGSVYLMGETGSTNLTTTNALQASRPGALDAYVVKLDDVDTTPPEILAAANYGESNVITLSFSEALSLVSATNAANYVLDQGVTVNAVSMGFNSRTVRLLTSGLAPGTNYTLSVRGVSDRAPVPNVVAPDTTAAFTAMNLYRGFLRQENYSAVDPAGGLAALRNHPGFPDQPDAVTTLHEFEVVSRAYPVDGLRVSGWLLPPVTGEYTFFLCSLGQVAELYLSRDASPINRFRVAFELYGFSAARAWNHPVAGWNDSPLPNVSLPVFLEANRAYYLEAIVGSHPAHALGLTWQTPGQPVPRDGDPPIPGAHLALLGNPANETLTIVVQPEDISAGEGESASFTVKVAASQPNPFYQWRRNGINLPGANAPSYYLEETSPSDHGSRYDCVVTIPGASVTSQPALLTVTNDVAPPTLLLAEGNLSNGHLTLTFSEPISFEDATNIANYALSNGLTVSNAVLLADRRTVVLTTSPQAPGSNYTVQVSGIRDRSAASNPVASSSEAPFFGWVDEQSVGPFPSWLSVKEDYGAVGDGVADDTDALQQALDVVAVPGQPSVLYFPAGTYRITRTLHFHSRLSASLVGEDPVTTIIKWDGPADGEMMFANSVAMSRWTRFTWDGSGTARTAVHHGFTSGAYQVTGNLHTDEIFMDIGTGLAVDSPQGGDSHTIVRCHFLRCYNWGIVTASYNAIDWHVWDCLFADCRYGAASMTGSFHVYRSVFLRSTEKDILAGQTYTGIRGNLSIGSKSFLSNREPGQPGTIQGNTVLDSLDPTPLQWPEGASAIVLDNTVITDGASSNAPAAGFGDNLLSVGNTFTVSNPVAVGGRSIQLGDRVVSRDSFSPPPMMIPRFLPRSTSPVIEVPAAANAATIQQAIDTAATLNGQRPIVHLPFGTFRLDRSLVIPPHCDLQLVGDGFNAFGSRLEPVDGTLPALVRLVGPSRATLRDLHVGGVWQGTGITIENCDQPGARVFMEQVYLSGGGSNNLVVVRLDHTDVSMHDLGHGLSRGVSLRVIGGDRQALGESTGGRTVIFGGGAGGGNLVYQVERNGRLLAQDIWFEGGPGLFRLTDSGTFTLNCAKTAPFDASHMIDGGNGALTLDNFRGRVSLLTHWFEETSVRVTGEGAATELLLVGCGGYPDQTTPPLPSYVDNQSPDAHVEHLLSSVASRQIPHPAEPDPVFLRQMLAQVRTDTPRRLVPLPSGVTDVRMYRVSVEACRINLILSGSNGPPQLRSLPNQFIDERSLLLVTNAVTGPDADYDLYTTALGSSPPSGLTLDPLTGVIRWAPTEAQSPSTNLVTVIARSVASPALMATNVVTIVVNEVNQPPELGVPRDALSGEPLVLTDLDAWHPPSSIADLGNGNYDFSGWGAGFQFDSGSLAHQTVAGDFDVRVRLESIEFHAPETSAGLMVRELLEPGSRQFRLLATVAGTGSDGRQSHDSLAFQQRSRRDGDLAHIAGVSEATYPNQWIRIRREGQTFIAYRSADGQTWQELARTTASEPFERTLYVGLGVSAGVYDQPSLVRFREYQNLVTSLVDIPEQTVAEGEELRLELLAGDPDLPLQALTFSLDPGVPAGATIDPVTGVFIWTPTEDQGPGIYPITVRVTDDGTPPLSATNTFTAIVLEVNAAPTLTPIPTQTVDEGQRFGLTLTVSDPDVPASTLTFELATAPPSATIDPANGTIYWTPGESDGPGDHVFAIKVTDNGAPPLSGTQSFTVSVREVNVAPALDLIPDQTVNEHAPLTFTAKASDTDLPANKFTFSLGPKAPTAASFDPLTGRFTWTPTEAQGPGTYQVTFTATDDGVPPLSASETVPITVNEVNAAPVLAPIGNRTVEAQQPLTFIIAAADPDDTPANALTLGAAPLPVGATFDPLTGTFAWTPSEAQSGPFHVTFTATDDGVPPLSDTETITITVVEPPRPVTLSSLEVRDGQFRFTFAAQPGKSYLVQAKNDLDDPVWIDLLVIPAPPPLFEFAELLPGTGTRYYRVITSD